MYKTGTSELSEIKPYRYPAEQAIIDPDSPLAPGPVMLPSLLPRNPITGGSSPRRVPKKKAPSKYDQTEHARSMFTDTNLFRSFYIIHPDWCSEGPGVRRAIAQSRGHTNWANRPAQQPISARLPEHLSSRQLTRIPSAQNCTMRESRLERAKTMAPGEIKLDPVLERALAMIEAQPRRTPRE